MAWEVLSREGSGQIQSDVYSLETFPCTNLTIDILRAELHDPMICTDINGRFGVEQVIKAREILIDSERFFFESASA